MELQSISSIIFKIVMALVIAGGIVAVGAIIIFLLFLAHYEYANQLITHFMQWLTLLL